MHRYLYIIFCSLCCFVQAYGQRYIKGRVVDGVTQAPLRGASVYINQSTYGTVTDTAGNFFIDALHPGRYEVVASFVGYKAQVYLADLRGQQLNITFSMETKVQELKDILVLDDAKRQEYLKIFRDNFLGITEAASQCIISNEEEIIFYNETQGAVQAKTFVPLVVINSKLGYRVHFQLEDFFIQTRNGQTFFYGYSRYEELDSSNVVPQRYIKARAAYYKGSTLHFFHSLLRRETMANGFEVRTLFRQKMPDTAALSGNQQAPKRLDKSGTRHATAFNNNIHYKFVAVPDSVLLAEAMIDGAPAWRLQCDSMLRIHYKKNPVEKTHLSRKVFLDGGPQNGVNMGMAVLARPVYIDKNGNLFNPLSIAYTGFWSYEKLAVMLPVNYRPR